MSFLTFPSNFSLNFIQKMFAHLGIFRSPLDCKYMKYLIIFFQNKKLLEIASQKSEKSFLEELKDLFVEKYLLNLMFEFLNINIQTICFDTEMRFNIVLPLGSTVKELEISIMEKIYDKNGKIAKNIHLMNGSIFLNKELQIIKILGNVYFKFILHNY
jgi:hypothetical protein